MDTRTRHETQQPAWIDPRDQIEVGVLLTDGRLAGRTFSSRQEAQEWAQPGEQVVELNLVCGCDR